jgi:hypothetical protein
MLLKNLFQNLTRPMRFCRIVISGLSTFRNVGRNNNSDNDDVDVDVEIFYSRHGKENFGFEKRF